MSANGWYSKQDVIKDLVEVTGKCFNDFGEHCVVGENPPPAWRTDEDEDLSRFFGGEKLMKSDNMEKPDLVGITQMLRMVDNYYEIPNDSATSNGEHMKSKTTNTESANIIVSISKLNPDVNEFVPQKSVPNSSIDVVSKISKKELKVAKDVNLSNVEDAKETFKTDCCDKIETNISNNKIDISQLLSSELKEMREQLKTKISDTSKVKCVKLRRERNLAIATLLKLYCQKPADENKPNLICPDYFKNNPANKNDVTEQNYVKTVSKNNTNDIFNESNLNTSEDEIIKKEIAASVEKVTRWLRYSEPDKISEQYNKDITESTSFIPEIGNPIKKTKGPSIHLGPVTFKRKTNNNHPATTVNSQIMSPVSLQSDNSKTKSDTFVPSVYASELAKKYIQQNKQKQETQTDIWTNLETQLKEKGEAIKKQRLQTMT